MRDDLRTGPINFDPHASAIAVMALHEEHLGMATTLAPMVMPAERFHVASDEATLVPPTTDPHGYIRGAKRFCIIGSTVGLVAIAVTLTGRAVGWW